MIHVDSRSYEDVLLLKFSLPVLYSISNDLIRLVFYKIDPVYSLEHPCHIFLFPVNQVVNVTIVRRLHAYHCLSAYSLLFGKHA